MMRGLIAGALGASMTLLVSGAQAAVLEVNGDGQLTGATGVLVDGAAYDVAFLQGACAALYTGCDDVSDFVFGTAAAATLAAQALLDQVFIDGPLGDFDSDPTLTLGVRYAFTGFASTPWAAGARVIVAQNQSGTTADGIGTAAYGENADFTGHDRVVFAVWSASADVPLPAAGWMLAAGLGGLGLMRRRG